MTAGGMNALAERPGWRRRVQSYAADFARYVAAETRLGLNETLGLSGSLRAAVHDIEIKLKEIDDPRLTSWMLMMRRHEKDFMLRRDPKYIGELKKAVGEFSMAIEVRRSSGGGDGRNHGQARRNTRSEFAAWAETAQQIAASRRQHDEDISRASSPDGRGRTRPSTPVHAGRRCRSGNARCREACGCWSPSRSSSSSCAPVAS